jgi:hypothetical protein
MMASAAVKTKVASDLDEGSWKEIARDPRGMETQ